MQNQKPVGRGSFSVIGRSNPPLQVSTQGRGYRLHRESVEQLRDATWYACRRRPRSAGFGSSIYFD